MKKAMVLAAGLGTRLRPWTLTHPKALVPVGGVPMLERVLTRLENEGFGLIVVNVHHFAGQIIRYLESRQSKARIEISDESGLLLDTGGGLLHAAPILSADPDPVLVHNVDILSDAPLADLYSAHTASDADTTLLVSPRESSRRLLFSHDGLLRGWRDMKSGALRPAGFSPSPSMSAIAFSGIYVISPSLFGAMEDWAPGPVFPIMDFLLATCSVSRYRAYLLPSLHLIDIGKPETLAQARSLF